MPSGAKKRKAAKKKKVHNSTSTNPHQGEDGGSELPSPVSQDNQTAQDPSVEVVNKETNGDESTISIEAEEKSKSSSSSSSSSSDDDSKEKKEVVVEPASTESIPPTEPIVEESDAAPIVDETKTEEETKELVPPVESSPETVPDKVEESEVPPIVDPVDSSVQEVEKVYDETPEVVEEPIVDSVVALKDEIPASSVDESVSKDTTLLKLSTPPEGLVSSAHETDTVEHSDRKAVVASPSIEERQLASWKNCCGIFELFSGSGR